ncbi:flagellar P-ring protein precursor FlgI [Syntrophus gentianae]|uniref:Flagellar P-ring protein n=1 Tax=Syntrophus gentianae TaxID=43775 RepID=A0A1H7XRQ3_9BACT|nr:flagellar basal body P-ring protein FlgI [Syntrophus gentianae]SEM35669.1 flagellar P-ring protein precursor FlgI [Syntrophus gentianae]
MKRFLILKILISLVIAFSFSFVPPVFSARLKDIASISGVRDNQLIGYGLVVGLAGTGDDIKNGFTSESLSNMLNRQGIYMRSKTLKSDNVAAVMVTATLPAFAKTGSKIDAIVSSIGDATSLHGGTLLMTPLKGADGQIYAVAQGPIILGGYAFGGANSSAGKNHASAGRVVNGVLVEKELKYDFGQLRSLTLNLLQPDFTTSTRLSDVVNKELGKYVEATQVDAFSIEVKMKETVQADLMHLISRMENLDIPVDSKAMVVMNEKTGTIVMGENVRIATVAVAHGNLSIQIKEDVRVSQPLPFAPNPPKGDLPSKDRKNGTIVAPGGQTVVTKDTTVGVGEEKNQVMVVSKGVTIQDVVKALNAIGVSPRDLITIMQTIKAAGALQAELKII